MKQYNFRLSTRIIIGAIFLVMAGFLSLMFIEEARLRDAHKNKLRTDLEQSLQTEKLRLTQTIKALRQDALFLSNVPPISGIMRATLNHGYDARDGDSRARWEARLQQIFSAYSAAHPDYYQIRYIGLAEGGREIVRIDNLAGKIEITPPAKLQAKGDRDYFKATLGLHAGEVYLSEFNLNRELGAIEQPHRPTLRAATPVFTPSGQLFGMVVINMGVGHLLESAASGLPAGVRAYITNMGGEYLLHPDSTRSFDFELEHKGKITTNFPMLETLFDPRVSGYFPLQAVATKAGTKYLAAERVHFDSDDPARFLLLAYSLPDAVLAEQITLIPPERLFGGFIAMLLVSGLALLVLRKMFSPLDQLTAAADKIAAGSYDILLPQTGSGEIGRLANALGAMLGKLSQRERDILQINTDLEERVKDRTYELSAINELLRGEVSKGNRLLHETEMLLLRNRALMQTSMDGIHVMDVQGNLVAANDAFCRMLGYTTEEVAMLNVVDWEAQWPIEQLQQSFKELVGKSAKFETVHRRKDGSLIDVEISISGIEIEEHCFLFAASRDITVRKQAEAALQESEEKFRSIFEQAGVGVAIIDSKTGQFQQVNKKYADIIGLDTDEMLVTSFMAITHPDDLQADLDNMNKLRDGLITEFTIEKRYIHKNGSIVWVSLTVSPLWLEGDKLSQHVAIVADITERKHIENELRIAAAAFETQDAIMITDANGNIIRVNHAFSIITGYSTDEVLGNNISVINQWLGGEDACIERLQQSICDGSWAGEIYDQRKNGQIYPKWMTVTAIRNERQEITHYVSIFSDLTARKQVEEARLRESEERFRGTLEQAAVGIAHATLDGCFQQVNQKFCKIVGYSRDELIQMSFHDITFPADLDKNIRYIRQLLAGEISTFSMEKRYVRKNQSLVWVNLTVSLLRDADGTPKYSIGVIEDITERKRSEALVQQFGSLLQSSFNEIYIFDARSLCFLMTSEGAEKNLGYSSDELNQLTPIDIKPSFTRESFERMIAPLRKDDRESLHFETFHRRKDGTTYPVEVRLQFCSSMEADLDVFMAIVQDITERKQADMEINQSRKSLRELVMQGEVLREEERKHIAREVHDELGQILTALRMKVSLLRIEFGRHDTALLEKIEGVTELLDQSIQCARDVVANLRPVALEMGVIPSIKWLHDEFIRHTGISCVLYAPEEEIHLEEVLTMAAFRVVQESLTNVAKHAEASKVEIIITQDADNFSVTVNDNGKGFDYLAISNRKSFGLLGMRERAIALGGVVNIYSAPQQGTQIFFVAPNKQATTDTEGDNP